MSGAGKGEKSTAHSIIELVVIVIVALGVALGVQAFLIKPFKIPSASMVPTLEIGQRVLVNRLGTHFGDPEVGDILVFHPPKGAALNECGARHAADQANRIGTLLVNPGGPGYGGSVLAEQAEGIYRQDLLDHFDIVGFDPRGTGLSEPHIDCIDDYDPVFGLETGPDTKAEDMILQAGAASFVQGCIERSGDLLTHVGTVDAAADMDLIRQALGEEQISYFGWSYGTDLGATWATMFPDTVRAAVLDGSIDPTVGRVDGLVRRRRQ